MNPSGIHGARDLDMLPSPGVVVMALLRYSATGEILNYLVEFAGNKNTRRFKIVLLPLASLR